MKIRQLTIEDVSFTIEVLEEHTPVKGNALASGDDKEDRKAEQQIYRQLNRGNIWAWCTVKVTASWKGFTGTDYLGCCSYKSEKDFIRGGYYEDMQRTALNELNVELSIIEELVTC
jgi:hypothetical protein